MRYHFIRDNCCSFPVTKMCQTLNTSQSGYYRWRKNPFSIRKVKNKHLRKRIRELYREHKGMAGSPMITADLRSEPDFSSVGKNRVARQMKDMGLKCKAAKKYIVTTNSKHNEPVAPNLLNRQFTAVSPNTTWVRPITLYLFAKCLQKRKKHLQRKLQMLKFSGRGGRIRTQK